MKNQTIVALLIIIVISLAGFFALKFVGNGGEDTWICADGQWVQHGTPTSSMPTIGCGDATTTENVQEKTPGAQNQVSGEFKNGQVYKTYSTDEFEVRYPDWTQVAQSQIVGGVMPEVAVANTKCSFVIKKTPLPQGTSFKEYVQNLMQVEMKKMPIQVLKQEIGDTSAYFESEIVMGSTTVTSVSRSFLTSKGNSIGVAFLAPKKDFERSCRPVLVTEVFDSVVVK